MSEGPTWTELLEEGVDGHLQRGRAGQTSTQRNAAGYHCPEAWETWSWGGVRGTDEREGNKIRRKRVKGVVRWMSVIKEI